MRNEKACRGFHMGAEISASGERRLQSSFTTVVHGAHIEGCTWEHGLHEPNMPVPQPHRFSKTRRRALAVDHKVFLVRKAQGRKSTEVSFRCDAAQVIHITRVTQGRQHNKHKDCRGVGRRSCNIQEEQWRKNDPSLLSLRGPIFDTRTFRLIPSLCLRRASHP